MIERLPKAPDADGRQVGAAAVRRGVALLGLTLPAVGLVQACTRSDVTSVTVAALEVSPSSVTLVEGESRAFTAKVRDVDGSLLPASLVTWSSSDDSTMSVSAGGMATALRPGEAQVRATVQGVTGSALVRVEPGPVIVAATTGLVLTAGFQGSRPDPMDVGIANGGNGTLAGLSATIRYRQGERSGWLGLSLSSTTAPATLTLTAATSALPVGTFHATATLSSPSARDSLDILVELSVTEERPILGVAPAAMGFAGSAGGPSSLPQAIQISNAGGGTLTGLSTAVSYAGQGGWLTAALSSTTAPAVLSLTADPGALAPGSYTATVQVGSPDAFNGAQNVHVSFAVETDPLADLSVLKRGPGSVLLNDTVMFVLTVHNDGPRDAVGAVLQDSLPAGLVFARASGGASQDGGVVTWPLGVVRSGETVVDSVWAAGAQVGSTLNVARVSSVTKDPVAWNDRSVWSLAVQPRVADLAVTKTGPTSASVGTEITYAIAVENGAGPTAADSVVVTDVLPAGVRFVSATEGGTYDAGAGSVTWHVGSVPVGRRVAVGVTVSVVTDLYLVVRNTATVTSATDDPVRDNDSSTAVTELNAQADLGVTMKGPEEAPSGGRITYTVAIQHVGGTGAAEGVVVTDRLPPELGFVSATGGGTYSGDDRTVTWALADVPVGGASGVELTVDVGADVTGPVSSTAKVTSTTVDPNPANDESTVTTDVRPGVDLGITMKGPAKATAGTDVTYDIAVERVAGTGVAPDVVVSDVLPAELVFVSATGGGTYDAGSRTVTWKLGDLAAGDGAALHLTARMGSAASGSVGNTARVSSAGVDPVPGNDSATVATAVGRVADLSVTKSGPLFGLRGQEVTYTIRIDNVAGPSDASGVVVTDELPKNADFVSATGTAAYDDRSHTVSWTFGDVAMGGSVSVQVTVRIQSSAKKEVRDTARVTSSSKDPNDKNDSSTVRTIPL